MDSHSHREDCLERTRWAVSTTEPRKSDRYQNCLPLSPHEKRRGEEKRRGNLSFPLIRHSHQVRVRPSSPFRADQSISALKQRILEKRGSAAPCLFALGFFTNSFPLLRLPAWGSPSLLAPSTLPPTIAFRRLRVSVLVAVAATAGACAVHCLALCGDACLLRSTANLLLCRVPLFASCVVISFIPLCCDGS